MERISAELSFGYGGMYVCKLMSDGNLKVHMYVRDHYLFGCVIHRGFSESQDCCKFAVMKHGHWLLYWLLHIMLGSFYKALLSHCLVYDYIEELEG